MTGQEPLSSEVSLEDISFAYPGGRHVLRHVSWTLSGARRHLLVGPNGSGKSTLLGVLAGSLRPQSGTIHIGGEVVSGRRTLYEKVALMPQRVSPVAGLTVRDQVRLSAWLAGRSGREATVEAKRAVDAAMLGRMAGRRVRRLSGGQLRRVGFAEALARGAEVVLLDEPTAGLDDEGVEAMLRALEDAPSRVVVATHQPEVFSGLTATVVTSMSRLESPRTGRAV